MTHHVIFVDGTCIFCNRLVQLILARDKAGLFHFAHIQGDYARAAGARHKVALDIDAIYLLMDADTPTERLLVDGLAGREIWPRLFWFGGFIRWVPLFALNAYYRLFARYRYQLFGQYDSCRLPTPDERARFRSS